ncbi:MAG: phage virion morphogenesis protein [Nitrospirae bacterium]|nr:phage virion morphogenesis protein [Nitrospirota bacterium]
MSGAMIEVKVDDKEVREMLSQLKERTGNLKPAMSIIGQIVRSSIIKNFEAEGRPQKWQPLSMATLYLRIGGASSKKKRGGTKVGAIRKLASHKVLQDTARLKNSINSNAFSDRVEIGTNVIYGAIHQFGGAAGRGKKVTIPARPFLMVQDEDWPTIKNAVSDYLTKGLK